MAMRYMLDTNIASFLIRDEVQVVNRFNAVPSEYVFLSVITEAELLFGIARRPEATRLQALVQQFLAKSNILQWTSACALHFARERAALEQMGLLLADMDMMIAAHALSEDAVLVTNNVAFSRIAHLKVEDWTKL